MTKAYQWYYDGSLIGGATGKTHTLTTGQTDSNLIECRTEVTYGTDSVAALAEYPAAGGTLTTTWLTPQSSVTATSTPTFTIDMSSYGNGDILVIWYGTDQIPDSATYASNSMTLQTAATANASNAGGKITCYSYTLTGAGGATDSVVVNLPAGANNHVIAFAVIENGSISDAFAQTRPSVTDIDLTGAATVSVATNKILAVAVGEVDTGGFDWLAGATEVNEISGGSSTRYLSYADATNVSTGEHTVTADITNSPTYTSACDRSYSFIVVE